MHSVGRCLQFAGLILPPLSIVLRLGTVTMFASLVFAVCLFSIGRLIEGYSAG